MSYKKILFSSLLLICMLKSYPQQQALDSLRALYSKQKTDTGRLSTMWDIIDTYLDYRADSALFLANKILHLQKK